MTIVPVSTNKKQYLDLLLLGDEQEDMIDRYLDSGDMFVLLDPDPVGVCVVCDLGDGILEIKNIAIAPSSQRKGYGQRLIRFVEDHYRDHCHQLLAGTGDSPLTIPFYEKCGFREYHRVPNFFLEHYDHPIYEAGVLLTDMVYLSKAL